MPKVLHVENPKYTFNIKTKRNKIIANISLAQEEHSEKDLSSH